MRRAVFLDLNGTLVQPVIVDRLEALRVIDGVPHAVNRLCAAGFICPVVTVQSRIAKGLFSEDEFLTWFANFARRLASEGAVVAGPYVCPHRFGSGCACAKPKTLLYERAAAEQQIDLAASFVIGDSPADVEAAHRFGGRGCLLVPDSNSRRDPSSRDEFAAYLARSLDDAVNWILQMPDRRPSA